MSNQNLSKTKSKSVKIRIKIEIGTRKRLGVAQKLPKVE